MGSLGKDEFSRVREAAVDDAACWAVEAKAKDGKDPYSRRVVWVRKDSSVFAAVDYYDRQDRLLKTLRVSGIEAIDVIWTAQKMEMTNVQDKHSTVIAISEIRFNIPLGDSLFAAANLERGNPR
jgi:hypothetical protein